MESVNKNVSDEEFRNILEHIEMTDEQRTNMYIGKEYYILLDGSKSGLRVSPAILVALDNYTVEIHIKQENKFIDSCSWGYNSILRLKVTDTNYIITRPPTQIYNTEEECLRDNADKIKRKILNTVKNYIVGELEQRLDDGMDLSYIEKLVSKKSFMDGFINDVVSNVSRQRAVKEKMYNDFYSEYSMELKNKAEQDAQLAVSKEQKQQLIDDAYIMGQQDITSKLLEQFLKSEQAKQFKITGVEFKLENGYVNTYWQFGNR